MSDERHPRADLRVTRDWLAGHPMRGFLVASLFGGAAAASVQGLLRWTATPLRWSFAAMCAIAAVAALVATFSRGRDRR